MILGSRIQSDEVSTGQVYQTKQTPITALYTALRLTKTNLVEAVYASLDPAIPAFRQTTQHDRDSQERMVQSCSSSRFGLVNGEIRVLSGR